MMEKNSNNSIDSQNMIRDDVQFAKPNVYFIEEKVKNKSFDVTFQKTKKLNKLVKTQLQIDEAHK